MLLYFLKIFLNGHERNETEKSTDISAELVEVKNGKVTELQRLGFSLGCLHFSRIWRYCYRTLGPEKPCSVELALLQHRTVWQRDCQHASKLLESELWNSCKITASSNTVMAQWSSGRGGGSSGWALLFLILYTQTQIHRHAHSHFFLSV